MLRGGRANWVAPARCASRRPRGHRSGRAPVDGVVFGQLDAQSHHRQAPQEDALGGQGDDLLAAHELEVEQAAPVEDDSGGKTLISVMNFI